jgi:hypothetical protein
LPDEEQLPVDEPFCRVPTAGAEKRIDSMLEIMSAEQFVKELEPYRSPEELKKYQRYYKSGEGQYGEGDEFMGVRMGQVFALAKEFIDMPPAKIEKLLDSPFHEVRAGDSTRSSPSV